MSITPLISGQQISIDAHKRAGSADWDNRSDDIHLHKIVIESGDYYVIRIPINSPREIKVERNDKIVKVIPRKIKKEVQEAFKNKQKTESFVKDIVEAVKNYNDRTKTQEHRARQAMGNIKKAFGLDYPRTTIKGWIRNSLKLYSQLFEVKGTNYFVILTKDLFVIGEMAPLTFVDILMKTKTSESAKWRFEFMDESEPLR